MVKDNEKSCDKSMPADYELCGRGADVPPEASFMLTLSDDAMSPWLRKGDTVYVCAGAELEEFDVGLFMYGGSVLCRQWCEDYGGNVHLLCANPSMERENITVPAERRKELLPLGRVILKKKPTPPSY